MFLVRSLYVGIVIVVGGEDGGVVGLVVVENRGGCLICSLWCGGCGLGIGSGGGGGVYSMWDLVVGGIN